MGWVDNYLVKVGARLRFAHSIKVFYIYQLEIMVEASIGNTIFWPCLYMA